MASKPMPIERSNLAGYASRAKWATVSIETDGHVYVGRIYVPETKKRLSDVLADERPFINLAEVTVDDAAHSESYVAINKRFVRTVRILDEGEADVVPIRMR